ncbi:peptidase C39 [Bradyrhizobium nanningense]|uniref:Peptidase C39 n=1 Tax=Bradyrhizobium nanningense TaxID=1325118 RepID=A0A4Q0RSL5_9BRAD|nr:peptidase domain-containing ABC transporter [Bradyrhizobium nanningense]RXH22092.1 peptidase C39 [Bradyrhizobium nanningense]RXH28280.1 peptidase C39 [Bradyrhizobium nanningense]
MESTALETALKCFVAVARHHGIDLSIDRIRHDYALKPDDDISRLLPKIARSSGMRSRKLKVGWKDLQRLGEAYPTIARLNNGNSVVLLGFHEGKVGVLDPLADRLAVLRLDQATFCKKWNGELLLLRRTFALTDESRPFGFAWFIPEVVRNGATFRDIAVAAVMLQVLALALPIFIQITVDKVLVHHAYTTLYMLAAGVSAAVLFDSVFNYLRRILLVYASARIDVRTSIRTFERLLSLPIDFFERASAGVITKHMQQVEKIREFLTGRLFLTLLDATSLLVVVPLLFFYSGSLATLVLGFSGMTACIIGGLIPLYRRKLRVLYEAEGQRQAYLVETIHGMETVKGLATEPLRQRDWDARCAQAAESRFDVGRISTSAQAVIGFLEKLLTVAVIGFGALLVFNGHMTVGALIAFNMLSGRVTTPLAQIVGLVQGYQEAGLSVRMLGQIMNRTPERPSHVRGLRPPIAGAVEFEHLTFRYSESAPPALDDVSVTIPAGAVFGIVGRSGSGKTTLTRLIRGMYPVQLGSVRIDGHDIRELDLPHLRSQVGVVMQQGFLFRGTVRENIAATKPDASLEEIVHAATMAGADEFIKVLPQGYDTFLEEGGTNLSGGQQQRLSIARALLRGPRILVLDEATSALDPESEAIVQANLARIAEGRTVIMVSHRLSSLVAADAIVVLDRGRIADYGKHNELLSRCMTYRQLWNQQHRHLAR